MSNMSNQNKDTEFYWKAAGIAVGLIGLAYLISKFTDSKGKAAVLDKAMQRKELERITSEGNKSSQPKTTPLNKSAFDEKNPNVESTEILSETHKAANAIRDNAFEKGAEDVAQPMEVINEKSKEAKPDNRIPPNSYVGAAGNSGAFGEGEVVWAYKNQDVRKVKVLGGNFEEKDSSGNPFGTVPYKHKAKLGVIHNLTPNGAFVKLAPDYKSYGYVDFENMYKLM